VPRPAPCWHGSHPGLLLIAAVPSGSSQGGSRPLVTPSPARPQPRYSTRHATRFARRHRSAVLARHPAGSPSTGHPRNRQGSRKSLALKPDGTRRYHIPPDAARTIAALLALRDQIIGPILAGVHSPRRGRKPAIRTRVDRDYETLRIDMQTLFHDLGITPAAAAPQTTFCRWEGMGEMQASSGARSGLMAFRQSAAPI
jgi:hypothetical protein